MFKLVKEIKSKEGVVHFRRYLLFTTPWFNCFLHKIYEPDKDKHLHSHPWHFWGVILWGKYLEENNLGIKSRGIGTWGCGDEKYFHKIQTVVKPVTSLFFTGKKDYIWGYQTQSGFVEHETYRSLKNSNQLPE